MKVDDYLDRPYRLVLIPDRDEQGNAGWVAEVDELPGCLTQGETAAEAISRLREAMADWLTVALESGVPIPEPRAEQRHSGKFLVRLPAGLHSELARRAELEGTSLNQFVSAVLAGAVAWRSRESAGV